MAQKLSVQIALEGGKEVERQLAAIGEEGQKAFQQIDQAAQQAGGFRNLKMGDVTAQLKEMGVTAVDSINQIKQAVRTAGKFEDLTAGTQSMEQGFAKVAASATRATVAFGLTRRELGALRTTLRQVDLGPLGGQFMAFGRIGGAFGPVGITIAAVGVAVAAATAAAIAFAQSITKISAEAIKLGLSFQEFDAARLRLEKLGISADAISAAFQRIQQFRERMGLEQVERDAEAVKQGFDGSDAALKRLKKTALEFTAAGDAAAQALRSMGIKIPGLNEADIRKYGIELTRLKVLAEQLTGHKIDIQVFIDASAAEQLEAIQELLRLMPDGAERTALAFRFLGDGAAAFIQQLRSAEGSLTGVERDAIALTSAVNQLQAAFTRFAGVAIAPYLNVVTAEINAVTNALQAIQNAITNFSWNTFTDAVIAAGNALKFFSIQGLAVLGIKWVWDLSGFDALIDKLAQATQSWLEYFGITSKAGGTPLPGGAPIGGPGGGIGGQARGGLLGGRGTGTSDSNLAWVSRGEHIMPARAVAQPGVLAFLEALRRSGGNLSRVLDGMGRFALGGMVPRAIPAFASGGLAGGGSNVTIQFPGLPAISGLRASSDVVDQLHRAAALAQVRSGGRKPSRYS